MKFTLVFSGDEGFDCTVGCVFASSLVWKVGNRTVFTPHPEQPLYQRQDLQNLIEQTGLGRKIQSSNKKMCLVVHDFGHGSDACLLALERDLVDCGFEPTIQRI